MAARDFFDGVGHHPYSFPTNPLEAHSWNSYTQTRAVYDVMVEFGDGDKKVWGTEMGVPTGTSVFAMSEADQAQWVHDYYLGWNTDYAAFTGPLAWKSIRDQSADPGDVWDNAGLLRNDGTSKPAYPAFLAVMTNGLP